MITAVVLAIFFGFLVYQITRLPGMALVGLFCMFAAEQWAQSHSAFFVERGALLNILFALVAAFALTLRVYRSELRSDPYPLGAWLVIMLFSYALLSTIWTGEKINTQSIWRDWLPYIMVHLVIAPLLIANPKDLTKIFSYQVFIGGTLAALIVFGTEYLGRTVVLATEDGRVLRGNPLAVAEMGGITIICAIMVPRIFRGDILVKLLIASICLVAIVKSGSRGQLIALVFAILVAFPFTYSIKNPKIFVGSALIAILLAYVVVAGLDTFWMDRGRFTGEGMSTDYAKRLNSVERLIEAWLADPTAIIFGLGNSASYNPQIIGAYPHFVPVEILAEEGIIGILLYSWMLLLVARESFYVLRRREITKDERVSFAILIGIIVYMFMISLKQGSLLSNTTFFMSVMIYLKAVAFTRAGDRKRKTAYLHKKKSIGAASDGAAVS